MLLPTSAIQATKTALSSWPPCDPASPAILSIVAAHPLLSGVAAYALSANLLYLSRRAFLRRTTPWDILRIRTKREPGVTWSMYSVSILAWQAFVVLFPVLEPIARLFGYVSFMFSYPNANGFGYIMEPVELQHLPFTKRSKQQVRFDWHQFSVNVGAIGREGYRHPPTVQRNLPHIDAPSWGVRHWPWRRRHSMHRTSRLYNSRVNKFDDDRSRRS